VDYLKVCQEMMDALAEWQDEETSEEIRLKIARIRRMYFNFSKENNKLGS